MTGKKIVHLTTRCLRFYKKVMGVDELKCAVCGKKLKVGDLIVKRGKVSYYLKAQKLGGGRAMLWLECADCFNRRFYDLPDVTEEEVEKLEVLTPFLNSEEVRLCQDRRRK